MLISGLLYIFAVFLTYLTAGLLLLPIIRELGSFSVVSYVVIAILVIMAGLLEIKDFFFYGRWLTLGIFPSEAKRIKRYIQNISGNYATALFLGVFVALVELPCTGAVYLAVLTLMSVAGVNALNISYLIVYNIIFVFPLVLILLLFYKGVSAKKFKDWHTKHKKLMRLMTGIVLVLLGIWMLSTVGFFEFLS